MTQELKEYIEHYINLIEADDYLPLYRGLTNSLRGELTEVLHDSEIYPEAHVDMIPSAFASDTTKIKHIQLADDCVIIGTSAFRGSKLETIELNNHLHEIEYEAFAFCHELKSIDIPHSVKHIRDSAFLDCRNIEYVKLSNTLEEIEQFTFCQCEKLEQLTIPVSVKTIGQAAFLRCYCLRNLHYEGTMKQWEKVVKHPNWNHGNDIVSIVCTDGTISLL